MEPQRVRLEAEGSVMAMPMAAVSHFGAGFFSSRICSFSALEWAFFGGTQGRMGFTIATADLILV